MWIKANIKGPHHWPLWGESICDRCIPLTKGQLRAKCFHLMTLPYTLPSRPVSRIWQCQWQWQRCHKYDIYIPFNFLVHIHEIAGQFYSDVDGVLNHWDSIICSTFCSGMDQSKHQSSASVAFARGIHLWPVDSPHKGPVSRKIFPFDGVIMQGVLINKHEEDWNVGRLFAWCIYIAYRGLHWLICETLSQDLVNSRNIEFGWQNKISLWYLTDVWTALLHKIQTNSKRLNLNLATSKLIEIRRYDVQPLVT